ncbi:MAG: hypothetical protein ACK4Z7_11860 [Novosphingobium sp.]
MAGMARIILVSLALSACSQSGPSDGEAIAAVKAAQDGKPSLERIEPQPILYPDITRHKLHGTGCAFVADGGGIGAVLLAQDTRGVIKLKGEVEVLAPDAGAAELPKGGRSRYTGKTHALSLTPTGPVQAVGTEDRFKGRLVITDAFERPVYEATGDVQCKTI